MARIFNNDPIRASFDFYYGWIRSNGNLGSGKAPKLQEGLSKLSQKAKSNIAICFVVIRPIEIIYVFLKI